MKTYFLLILFVLTLGSASTYAEVWLDENDQSAASDSLTSYYDQFLYQPDGSCAEISKLWFMSTHSWVSAQLGEDSKNRRVIADISLQLFPDKTYWADYEEKAITKVEPGRIQYEGLFNKKFGGTWTVNGDKIELSNIGFGLPTTDGVTVPNKPRSAFKLQFTLKINDNRILNASMTISRSMTNIGPKGISINEYCQVKPQ